MWVVLITGSTDGHERRLGELLKTLETAELDAVKRASAQSKKPRHR